MQSIEIHIGCAKHTLVFPHLSAHRCSEKQIEIYQLDDLVHFSSIFLNFFFIQKNNKIRKHSVCKMNFRPFLSVAI